ncbi:MAG: hypothetical protein LBH91_06370 [Prevotellaceae bacterium]|jgi:hypothetical protein|nr:hypothetical protein [Prevotellaceae bacterium]
MKITILKYTVLLLIVAGCFTSCEKGNVQLLEGTRWKLIGIVDVQTGDLIELEPINCNEYYTLTFDTGSTFQTFSSVNELQGIYKADYTNQTIQIVNFGGTKMGELGDGNLYADPFGEMAIQSFSLQGSELKLYYNDKKNYLKYKKNRRLK